MSRTMSTNALRLVAAGALGLPLTLGAATVASASTPAYGGDCGPAGGARTVQGGSLVDALAQVAPAANVGGILSKGPVTQTAYTGGNANSGIQGGGHGGGTESFQAGDLVAGLVQVNPAVNVGGVLNDGPVTQTAYTGGNANSGIQGGGSGKAAQGGSLLGLGLQVNPAINVGGILSSGPVTQQAGSAGNANSGIQS